VPALQQALSLAAGARVADIGCGTGLSCLPFLQAGLRVAGVEPNASMRAHALALAASWPGLTVHEGTAEATGLEAGSVDLLVAAQAFHWFDVAAARAESLRILRAPPRAALVWNDRDTTGSAFARGLEALIRAYSPDYLEIKHQHDRLDRVAQYFGSTGWQTLTLPHGDDLDLDTLTGRVSSASYMPAAHDARHAPLMRDLRALFERTARDGRVRMEFVTRALVGQLERPPAVAAR